MKSTTSRSRLVRVSNRAIQIAIVDRYLNEGVHGALILGDDSFYQILIFTINLRS